MSSAGHVMDMINRFNNNRNLQKERHSRYAKVKKAYQKAEAKHAPLTRTIELSALELDELRNKIRVQLIHERKKQLLLTALFTPIAVTLVCWILWRLIVVWFS